MNQYIKQKEDEFKNLIDFFQKDISSLRTGRANPVLLEGIHADAYGVRTPLSGLASISVNDSKSMSISPWDKNVLKSIEKAITEADLGVSVNNEGDKIRIIIPQITEESRKELVKKLNEKHENARIKIRQVREEIKNSVEEAEKNKEISEDDKFMYLKQLEEEMTKRSDDLKEIRDKKEGDIMTV